MDIGISPVSNMRSEFQNHISQSAGSAFVSSVTAQAGVAKLTKELELRRQTSELTEMEAQQLREIDQLAEDIAKFNQNSRSTGAGSGPTNQVYDLSKSQLQPEETVTEPVIVPQISQAEADQIISRLDQQFEEKVMSRLKRHKDVQITQEEIDQAEPGKSQNDGGESGRNLQDFLSVVRDERPSAPFLDADSHADLSRLKSKIAG